MTKKIGIINIKKRAICILLCLMALSSNLFALSVHNTSAKGEQTQNSFDSIPMLQAYYDESLENTDEDFWNSCEIWLVTIGEGDPLYSWFGHSALLVEAPGYPAYFYDYGTFSFDADGFYKNFALGRLWFCCNISYAAYELAYLEETGRPYSQVKLNLTAGQKKAIINFLNINSSEEHRTYLYNHYTDNCATRLRDIINYATGGDFEAWAKTINGRTFRQLASSALSKNRPIQWILEFLQSGQIDTSATLWDEMFLPAILEEALLQYGSSTGLLQPDTYDSSSLVSAGGVQPKSNLLFSVLTGLILSALCLLLLWRGRTKGHWGLYKAYAFTLNLFLGLLGTLLMFMMFFTNHNVTWYNENLLFVNPILIAMAIMTLKVNKPKLRKTLIIIYRILLAILAILVVLKLILPSIFLQDNWTVFVVVAPYYLVNEILLNIGLRED